MEVLAGDCFSITLDGAEVPLRAVFSPDGGTTWHCCRTDRALSEAAIMVSTKELLKSLGEQDQADG